MALKRSAASGAAAGEGENAGMTCTKCGGLVIDEWGERRCVNCGRRPDEAHVMQTEDRRPKTEESTPRPRPGWTPERRQKFLATMRQRGHFGRGPQAGSSASVPTRRHATPKVGEGMIVLDTISIDRTIEQLNADLATLQRAKQIMTHCASRSTNDEASC